MKASESPGAPSVDAAEVIYFPGAAWSEECAKAIAWFRNAAENGHPDSQHHLGLVYLLEVGGRNSTEAIKWLRKAAENGHAGAQFQLACIYCNGTDVTADGAEALKWFKRAVEQGQTRAASELWRLGAPGNGVPFEKSEPVRWIRQAGELERSEADKKRGAILSTVA